MTQLSETQTRLAIWQNGNFPARDKSRKILQVALGVAEESGELCHAVLKRDQGIRGTYTENTDKMRDAIGDIAIFAMQICSAEGWDFEQVVIETAEQVMKRKWVAQ
jgi:NTP pyrophosphatase (non-canonical NTP hydrolase)